jgi:hypothetical protein
MFWRIFMQFTQSKIFSLTILGILALTSCTSIGSNSKDLTRAKALPLINAAKELAQPTAQVGVTKECLDIAVRDGFFMASYPTEQLSPKASQHFSKYWYFAGTATLQTPLKRKAIEVTGITDAPIGTGTKVVQFKWEYVDVPDFVNRYTGTTGIPHEEGQALLKLYDDGWRVEEVHIQ